MAIKAQVISLSTAYFEQRPLTVSMIPTNFNFLFETRDKDSTRVWLLIFGHAHGIGAVSNKGDSG